MMQKSSDRSLRKLLIYPKFQLKLIFTHIILLLGSIVLIGIQMNRSISHLKDVGVEAGLAPTHPYFDFMTYQTELINNYLIYAFLISVFISSVVVIYLSHRVSGPIVRLSKFFKQIKETGKIETLKFRKEDYFSDLTEEVNLALEKLKN